MSTANRANDGVRAGRRARHAHAAADRTTAEAAGAARRPAADRSRARPPRRGRHHARRRQRALSTPTSSKRIWPARTTPQIVISDERGALLDTGGGVVHALPLLGAEPFLIHNSDSVWIEGVGSNLARLLDAWDDERMDSLMLLAPAATSLGYDGRGDFFMAADGRARAPSGSAQSRRSSSRASRSRTRACSRMRRKASSRSTCSGTAPSTRAASSASAGRHLDARRRPAALAEAESWQTGESQAVGRARS